MVAAARAVAVEVGRGDLVLDADSCPAGLSTLIEPAGEMWSVVIESPNIASGRAPTMSVGGSGVIVMPSK